MTIADELRLMSQEDLTQSADGMAVILYRKGAPPAITYLGEGEPHEYAEIMKQAARLRFLS